MAHFRCMPMLFICLNFLFYETGVRGDGIIMVRFESYTNPGGKGNNGHCCDGKFHFCQKNGCDHKFVVCLQDSYITSDDSLADMDDECTYGLVSTEAVKNMDVIKKFGDSFGETFNPLTFSFDGALPSKVTLVVEVWDDDHVTHDDFVETLSSDISFSNQDLQRGFRVILNGRTTLVTRVGVECDEDWYGEGCGVYCAIPGLDDNYYCEKNTGEKICFPGVTGENCDEPVIPPTSSYPTRRTVPFSTQTRRSTRTPTRTTTTEPRAETADEAEPSTRATSYPSSPTPRTIIVTLPTRRPSSTTTATRKTTTTPNSLDCVSECSFLPDGDYRSCEGCDVYVTCSNGITYDMRPCPEGTGWNNDFRRCEDSSAGNDCTYP